MKKTDINKIEYPTGMLAADRRFCRNIINTVRDFFVAQNINHAIVACSGGADSVCLADICSKVNTICGTQFSLAYINHNLRPEENKIELEFTKKLAGYYRFCYKAHSIDLPSGSNLEERARILRYAALKEIVKTEHADGVVVAHHADDDFETIIMRLIDNRYIRTPFAEHSAAGFQRTVYGMKPVSTVDGLRIFRPLLGLTRDDLRKYMRAFHINAWCEDSSNNDFRFRRNAIRKEVMPRLKQIKRS